MAKLSTPDDSLVAHFRNGLSMPSSSREVQLTSQASSWIIGAGTEEHISAYHAAPRYSQAQICGEHSRDTGNGSSMVVVAEACAL